VKIRYVCIVLQIGLYVRKSVSVSECEVVTSVEEALTLHSTIDVEKWMELSLSKRYDVLCVI
jgi:hypothetical protein